jgi:hypothetical protein
LTYTQAAGFGVTPFTQVPLLGPILAQ